MRDYLWKVATIAVVAALLLGCGGGKSKVTGVSVDKPAPTAEEALSSDDVQQVKPQDDTQRVKEGDVNESETPSSLDDLLKMIVEEEKAELSRLGGKPPATKQVAALPDTKLGDEEWAVGPPGHYQENTSEHWMEIWSSSDNLEDLGFMAYAIYKFEGHSGDNVTQLNADIAVAPGNEFYIYLVNYSGAAQWQQFGPFSTPPEPPQWPLDITFQAVSVLGNVYVAVVVYDLSMVRIHSLTVSGSAPDLYPPENVQASDGTFEDRIRITWSHPSSGPTPDGYKILRSTSENGSYQQRGSVDYPATQWDDMNVPDYETYWYKARSFKSGYSDSGDSNKNDGYRQEPGQLYPPENLQASDGILEDRIRVTWSHPSSGPTPDGYKILRSTSENGSYQQRGSVDYPATQWDDMNVPDYEIYWYKARSFKSGYSDSGDSNKDDGYRKPDYDEDENNDSRAQANPFPSFDFSDFTGSLGPGGYDGDDDDWFKFSHSDPVDWTVKLWLHLDSSTGDLDMVLEDSNGDFLKGSYNTGDEEYIEYTFQSGDTSPFYLHVYAYSGFSDYSIDGQLIEPSPDYDETEDNDNLSQADQLPSFPFNDWDGNVGPTGSYDGDNSDYSKFTRNTPARIQYYANATPNTVRFYLKDTDDDYWWDYFDGDDSSDTVTIPLAYPGQHYLKAVRTSSYSDYELHAQFLSGWPDIGESNDNVYSSHQVDVDDYLGAWCRRSDDIYDFYKFTLDESAIVWVLLSTQWAPNEQDDIVGRWAGISEDGEYPFIGIIDDQLAEPSFDVGVMMPLSPGTYHFRWYAHPDSSGTLYYVFLVKPYSWSTYADSWKSSYNRNNTYDSPQNMGLNYNARGLIDSVDWNPDNWKWDGEFWKIYLNAGTTYYISMVHWGDEEGEDLDLDLYDTAENWKAGSSDTDARELIMYTPSQSGYYVIRVDPYNEPSDPVGVAYQIVAATYTMEDI